MKVLIMTLGTRGDVQPFVALARGLTSMVGLVNTARRLAGKVTSPASTMAALAPTSRISAP